MRMPVLRAVAALTLCGLVPANIAQAANEALSPARDFSGVWTSYSPPGQAGGGAGRGAGGIAQAEPPFTPKARGCATSTSSSPSKATILRLIAYLMACRP